MNRLWGLFGIICYWLSWPANWMYLRGSQRTRVMVVHDGKILVVKVLLGDGRWCLPGGGRHANEPAIAGIQRELREETSLELPPEAFRHLAVLPFAESGFRFSYELFGVSLNDRPAVKTQRFEIFSYAWLAPEELTPKNARSDVMQALGHWPL